MDDRQLRKGLWYGVGAYGLWGLIPLYFKCLTHVPPSEILAHRVLWSFLVLAGIVTFERRWIELGQALKSGRLLLWLSASTLLIAINWFTFIYAVSTRQTIQSSLGYFITPLVNVLLGLLFLNERLRVFQTCAILLAAVGVVSLGILAGQPPWIALALAGSFALYGLLRKTMAVDGLLGLFVETLLLLPLSLVWIAYLAATSSSVFTGDRGTDALLAASGVITTVPLLFFGAAARRLRLATLGILQYLAPSLQFLLAVLVFHEPLTGPRLACFVCIWAAVAIYFADSVRSFRNEREKLAASTSVVPNTLGRGDRELPEA